MPAQIKSAPSFSILTKIYPRKKKQPRWSHYTGQKITGMLKVNDNFSLSLQTLDGAFHFLPRSELAQVDIGSRSLMPAASTLSSKEVDDLVSYLLHTGVKTLTPNPQRQTDDDDN